MMKRILITRFPYLAVLFSLLLVLTACSQPGHAHGRKCYPGVPLRGGLPVLSGGHHYHADGKPDGKDTGGSLLSY